MARFDFVGVSSDALTAVSCVEVDQEGTMAEDHRLVSVSLQWSLQRRAAPLPSYASRASFADMAKLRLPSVCEAIEEMWRDTPPVLAQRSPEMMERAFTRRATGFGGGLPQARPSPKENMVGS